MEAKSAEPRKDAVVVLGMHRSGTSAMARVLSLCGAALPENLLGASPSNPNGHWEPEEIRVFNDQILSGLDSGWNDMFGPRRNSQGELPTQGHLDRAAELIRLNWGDSPFIVFKEPRVSLLLDLWVEALKREGYRVCFIIMVRHPLEIADSLKTRNEMSRNQALILWASYLAAAETGTRDAPRMFVKFSDLLENPERVVDRAETELKLVFPRRSWAATNEIEQFLKTEDRHHLFTGEGGGGALATLGPLEKYYQYLAGAASGAAWNEDVSTELQAWLSSLENSVGPVLKRLEVDLRTANAATENEHRTVERIRAELATTLDARTESETVLRGQLEALAASAEASRAQAAGAEAELRAQLEALAASAEASRAQAADAEAELRAQLEANAASAEASRAQAADAEAELRAQLEAIAASAEASRAQAAAAEAELRAQLETIAASAEASRAQAADAEAELRAQLAALATNATVAREAAAGLEAKLATAEAERNTLNAELANQFAMAQAERYNVKILEESLAEARARFRVLEAAAEREQFQAKAETRDALVAARTAEEALEAAKTELQLQRTEFEQERSQVAVMLRSESERAAAIEEALTSQRAQAAAREAQLQTEIVEAQNRIGASESALTEAQVRLARQSSEFEVLRHQKAAELETFTNQSTQLADALSRAISDPTRIRRHATSELLLEIARRIRLPFLYSRTAP